MTMQFTTCVIQRSSKGTINLLSGLIACRIHLKLQIHIAALQTALALTRIPSPIRWIQPVLICATLSSSQGIIATLLFVNAFADITIGAVGAEIVWR